jgi:hypothetical protein
MDRAGAALKVAPSVPEGVVRVAEQPDGEGLHIHPGWTASLPAIVQGVTDRTAEMSLFGTAPTGEVIPRWQRLRDRLHCGVIVHARQIHRDHVLVHDDVPAGLLVGPDADGHATRRTRILLAVSVADCVPIYVAAPGAPAVALLHAGWRGVAAGILERGLEILRDSFGAGAADLYVHLGPAICGECFQVGPEVPRELGMADRDASHVDLRALLAHRAIGLGVDPARTTISHFCTRHGESPFYSHRGGCAERQIAVLALRHA